MFILSKYFLSPLKIFHDKKSSFLCIDTRKNQLASHSGLICVWCMLRNNDFLSFDIFDLTFFLNISERPPKLTKLFHRNRRIYWHICYKAFIVYCEILFPTFSRSSRNFSWLNWHWESWCGESVPTFEKCNWWLGVGSSEIHWTWNRWSIRYDRCQAIPMGLGQEILPKFKTY